MRLFGVAIRGERLAKIKEGGVFSIDKKKALYREE